MIGVWFTYGPDGPALLESIDSFRAAGGSHVAIFDEVRDPISADTLAAIQPDLRQSTTYKRGGNLRGWENVLGQLDCMERACLHFNGSGALKIDSDTLVLDLDWIHEDAPMSGFMAGGEAFLFGLAYHLRLDAIRTIRASMLGRYRSDKDPVAEDRTISTEAMWLWGQQVNVIGWNQKRAGGWDYGRTPPERYQNCAAITFGNRSMIPGPGSPCDKRELVAVAMAKYRATRREAPPPSQESTA